MFGHYLISHKCLISESVEISYVIKKYFLHRTYLLHVRIKQIVIISRIIKSLNTFARKRQDEKVKFEI